jgi:hypothetical protein
VQAPKNPVAIAEAPAANRALACLAIVARPMLLEVAPTRMRSSRCKRGTVAVQRKEPPDRGAVTVEGLRRRLRLECRVDDWYTGDGIFVDVVTAARVSPWAKPPASARGGKSQERVGPLRGSVPDE